MERNRRRTRGVASECRQISAAVLVAALAVVGMPNWAQAWGWSTVGGMAFTREQHTANLLPNGKVFVLGGQGTGAGIAQIYDPTYGSWSGAIYGPFARWRHTATLLPNGKILIAGGTTSSGPVQETEIFDPATQTFKVAGYMHEPRMDHTATLLSNGKVLVTGGCTAPGYSPTFTAEVWDPATSTWSWTGSMKIARANHTATVILRDYVLVAGGGDRAIGSFGSAGNRTEIYSALSGTWTSASNMLVSRYSHTATALSSDTVLLVGGSNFVNDAPARTAEIFRVYVGCSPQQCYPAGSSSSYAASPSVPRWGEHTATLLQDGEVLVAGGTDGADRPLASAELYNPLSNTWSSAGKMGSSRALHTATLLNSGAVLVTGGTYSAAGVVGSDAGGSSLSSAETYIPCPPYAICYYTRSGSL